MAPRLRGINEKKSSLGSAMTLDKAYTLSFLLSYLCKITVCRSSFAKTRFKRFPECLFSHRFLKLSACTIVLTSSLARELKPSCSIHNDCGLAVFGTVDKFVQTCKIFWVPIVHLSHITELWFEDNRGTQRGYSSKPLKGTC